MLVLRFIWDLLTHSRDVVIRDIRAALSGAAVVVV